MVEVLIAGILLASSTAAVSRISIAALSSSANISQRARIEADINDNIQALQMEDSYLTRNSIDEIFTTTWIANNYSEDINESLKKECEKEEENEKCKGSVEALYAALEEINTWNKQGLEAACIDTPLALAAYLKTVAPEPRNTNVLREFDYWSIPGILRVVYQFEGPEQQVKAEQRLVEMSPNFAAQCYTTE